MVKYYIVKSELYFVLYKQFC